LGSRSRRKSRPEPGAPKPKPTPDGGVKGAIARDRDQMGARYARGEARNEALRAGLEPLGPDERPTALLVATLVVGVLNIVLALAGVEVQDSSAGGAILLGVLFVVAAVGMHFKRAWAVLGFMVALAITLVFASLSILVASNVLGLVVSLAIIVLAGWLFWKLVRILGRMQAPPRPSRSS
jgi:hypothetical protein